jgi:sec-independent protein translocase protein TatC
MTPNPTSAEMPFLDHLEELRWRLIKALGALALTVILSFIALTQIDLIGIMARPILPLLNGHKLIFTHPTDSFSIYMTMSLTLGVVAALPVIAYQLWAFLSPALYRHEKRVVIPVAVGAVLLFVCGVGVSYFGVMPLALRWLLAFQTASMEPMISGLEYFDFLFTMSLAFGLCFELPIVILALTALGIVTPMFLRKYRRHSAVLCTFIGAFLTPGDLVWTTIAMAVPLYLLYELSIFLSTIMYRRRQRAQAALVPDEGYRAPA